MLYKTKIEINLPFADHRVIHHFAEKNNISRVVAIQIMLDNSPYFKECVKELLEESDSFKCDHLEREEDIEKKRKKIKYPL